MLPAETEGTGLRNNPEAFNTSAILCPSHTRPFNPAPDSLQAVIELSLHIRVLVARKERVTSS